MIWFTLLMAAFLAAHFLFAIREWRRWRGREASDIDLEYVRLEDYLGRSFRRKAADWLAEAAPQRPALTSPGRRDRIQVHAGGWESVDGASFEDVLVVKGDFACGAGARFAKEVYVEGSCRMGAGSTAQALAVDGDLLLEPQVRVARWIDCRGALDAAACEMGEKVTARTIRLGPGARAKSLCAGEITVLPLANAEAAPAAGRDLDLLVLELARPPLQADLEEAGLAPRRLKCLSDDTWLYQGDFHPHVPVRIEGKLLVRGSCAIPAGSVVGDLKAAGHIIIGERCRCEGNLTAGQNLRVGGGTLCAGVVFATGVVRLAGGMRGGTPDQGIAVYGGDGVFLDPGVTVHGKVAAGGALQVTTAPSGRRFREPRRTLSRAAKAAGVSMLFLCLGGSLRAQTAEAPPADSGPAPVRVEIAGFGSQVSPGFGYWRGVNAQVWLRSNPRFVPAFTVESQTRQPGVQQNYSFLSYMNWTPTFYTVQSVSVAPQRNAQAIYYPRDREDLKAFWKVGDSRRLVLDAGITRFNFGAPGRGQIYNAGALYYAGKLVVEGNLFVNRNQPKNLVSASGNLSVQYGRERSYWAGVTVGGGRELYNYVGIAPVDIDLASYSVQAFYRKWLSRHVGCVVSMLYLNKLGAYRQAGASAGMFFDF